MQKIIEYFLQFGVDANTTATLVVTLFTFVTGFVITWIGYKVKECRDRVSYRSSYIILLKDLRKSCEKQCVHVEKSLLKSSLIHSQGFNITHVIISGINIFDRVDFNDFLQNFEPIFVSKKYNKAISKLFEVHELIKYINVEIFNTQKELFERFSKHEQIYYKNMSEIRNLIDALNMKYNGKNVEKDMGIILQSYFDIFNAWYMAGQPRDMSSTHSMLIKKLLEVNGNRFRHPLVLEFNNYALASDLAFQNIIATEEAMRDSFKNFLFHHRRANRLLKVIIYRLEYGILSRAFHSIASRF